VTGLDAVDRQRRREDVGALDTWGRTRVGADAGVLEDLCGREEVLRGFEAELELRFRCRLRTEGFDDPEQLFGVGALVFAHGLEVRTHLVTEVSATADGTRLGEFLAGERVEPFLVEGVLQSFERQRVVEDVHVRVGLIELGGNLRWLLLFLFLSQHRVRPEQARTEDYPRARE